MIDFLSEVKNIYSNIVDFESRNIYENRLLYSITTDYKYIRNITNSKELERIRERIELFEQEGKKIFVFGAGFYGKKIVKDIFEDINWECFIDNNIQGNEVLGLKVIDFNEFKVNYFNEVVVITPWKENREIYNQLIDAGFDKKRIINIGEYISTFTCNQYFDVFSPFITKKESFVDVGCLDGYSSKNFVEWCNKNYNNIYAFEPEQLNYEQCKIQLNLPNCTVYNIGLWDKEDTIKFNSGLSGLSTIDLNGGSQIKVGKMDNVLKSKEVTFIKMDIEGAELKALEGAEHIIKNQKPRLAICIYHKPEDIITIPRLLLKYNPNYKFKLRHYSISELETVLYAFDEEE